MEKIKKILCISSFLTLLLYFKTSIYTCFANENKTLEVFKSEIGERSFPKLKEFRLKNMTKTYSYYKGKIKIDEVQDLISFHYYKSLRNDLQKPKPLVLIFPGITGLTPLDYYMGRYYSNLGYHVAISHYRDKINEKDPEKIDLSMKNGILASLSVLDTVAEFKEVDNKKIAVLGYSFGGIRASFLASIDDRISSTVLIVSSANLSRTLSLSKSPTIRKLRKIHMKKLKSTSIEYYEEFIKNKLPFEPYEYLPKCNYSNYLTVTSKIDTVVPWSVQESLVLQLTNPKHICFRTLGHCTSVFWFVVKHLNKTNQHFKSMWTEDNI